MRKQFCDAMVARAHDEALVFLTGDLGFMALEPLQAVLGSRFINAGVAEQNMVTVAAALARRGLEAWVYSIAPFCYARPFEQIRNDVAFHGLPVKLVGNGGGYGYGVMGPTHHAIEDYGVLLTLPGMRAFVPAFDEDVAAIVERVASADSPSYLRMGRGEPPAGFQVPRYEPWRQLVSGGGAVVVAVGPLAGSYVGAFEQLPLGRRPNLWVTCELPLGISRPPAELMRQLATSGELHVAEEHVQQGSVGAALALLLLEEGIACRRFRHHFARAHHFERYGSQAYLRQMSRLDPASIVTSLAD